MRLFAKVAVVGLMTACRADAPKPRAAAPSPLPASAVAPSAAPAELPVAPAPVVADVVGASACAATPVVVRRPMPQRLIAIGDVHGDLAATRALLQAADLVDATGTWRGGATVAVQVGDVLDRGDDEQALMEWFERLEREAAAAGGAWIWLWGNHELMNAAGDYRYVTPGGFADFDDAPGLGSAPLPAEVPPYAQARVRAMLPGGRYAQIMAGQPLLVIVGDIAFSHAGPGPGWAARLATAQHDGACWLEGKGAAGVLPDALTDDGPLWTRRYGLTPADCAGAATALAELGAKVLVVGHTVQDNGINAACDGAIWRIDVGLSKHYGGPLQALAWQGGKPPTIITGSR